ncbi:trypsin-like serine protease [Streptomyces sp. NPDC101118]|uniref:trypsin-like serine protease n=1 Tax=Streptomyces sp. NPDC101118 TaxID=3366109 RepID=UPI00381BF1D5
MSDSRKRSARTATTAVTATAVAAVAAGLLAVPASALTGTPAADGALAHTARLTIGEGDTARACSAVLVAADALLTAADCFAGRPGERVAAGKPARKSTAVLGTQTVELTALAPREDRQLVLAQLARPVTGVTPVRLAASGPAAGTTVTAAGFGRTKADWVPGRAHSGSFDAVASDAVTLRLKGRSGAGVCKGDAGGPVLAADGTLVALSSRSWGAGCLGTDPAETRTDAVAVRADGLAGWIAQTRALAPGWKTEALVQSGGGLHQAVRLADGTWTGSTDVQAAAGSVGGVRAASVAGINGDTHVVVLAADGRLHHTIRTADGRWGSFGHIGAVAGTLENVTQVSTVSVGADLHVVAVAGGRVFHTVRNATGHWTPFGDVEAATGPVGAVTQVATASAGGALQVIAVSGGKALHALRAPTGHWTAWGNVAQAAGPTGPVTSVAMAGTGGDAHVVVSTDGGTRQYHAIRKADGRWDSFGDLAGVLGNVTAGSVAAAGVDGELQVAVTTADGRVLHTVRHADRTWAKTLPVTLQGLPGTPGPVDLAGTL